jgi:Family of unknown function (DUF6152)
MRHLRGPRPAPTFLLLVVSLVLAFPALAHHSFAAYDVIHTRTIKGTLETLQWSNPHVTLKMLVKPELK